MFKKMLFHFILVLLCCSDLAFASSRRLITGKASKFDYVCDPQRFKILNLDIKQFAYCNKDLPYSVRVKDLIDRMTLEEKASQMISNATGVARIGLPAYFWWSEALHGVADTGPGTQFDKEVPGATTFPTVILTAASFNEKLWNNIGQVVSTEARAMHNLGKAGLTFWSPNINIVRDPRWGRALETPGEDPFLTGTYAINYVRGLQDIKGQEKTNDPNSRPLKVSACCKHFSAYDIENWDGIPRTKYDAQVAEQDMVETFNKPFEMCVKEGDVSSVMCSFNRVNGIPTCADHYLLTKTVKQDWQLHGYTVADCDSVQEMYSSIHFLNGSLAQESVYALKAGMDLDCGSSYSALATGVLNGKVKESDLDKSLFNLYTVLMRLGYFDGIPSLSSLGKQDICTKEHIELAAETARQGIVLLKNDKNTLPLKPESTNSLALVGPHANATEAMIGNYAGIPCKYISPIQGFSPYGKVHYSKGCLDVACKNSTYINDAVEAAKTADVTLIFVGLDLSVEREWVDRTNLLLPGFQTELVDKVSAAAKGKVILVVLTGGVVDLSFAQSNPKISSIIWAGYPGEQGGNAIADVVFGKQNPGGRLPLTWYPADYTENFPSTSMSLRRVGNFTGRTYKFYDGPTVYPFGYGLSYTKFEYKSEASPSNINIKLNNLQHCYQLKLKDGFKDKDCSSVQLKDLPCEEEVSFEVTVTNVGEVPGTEIVLVYTVPPNEIDMTHLKKLVGFDRVFLQPKESKKVNFTLNVCKAFDIVNFNAYKLLPEGDHQILAGDSVKIPVKITYSR